ncbi:hypothetical protein SVAN01_10542 [Stagonosporopsis vannaccii]|nr:hypothetical protein SVAN01_10542 [Stagonosporopsis vannaccii]
MLAGEEAGACSSTTCLVRLVLLCSSCIASIIIGADGDNRQLFEDNEGAAARWDKTTRAAQAERQPTLWPPHHEPRLGHRITCTRNCMKTTTGAIFEPHVERKSTFSVVWVLLVPVTQKAEQIIVGRTIGTVSWISKITSHCSGRTFEVLGAASALLDLELGLKDSVSLPDTAAKTIAVRKAITNVPLVAIKRAYVDEHHAASQVSRSSAESLTRAFGHQLVCVEREIENLCHPDLRGHPNIIKILGWGLCLDTLEDVRAPEPRIPLLVLERADCTLGHLVTSKELSCQFSCVQRHERQLGILQDIGNGLEAIHKAELIHGDIKLENILIFRHREGFVAKLSDFGLTVAGSGDDPTNVVSTYRGTPRWCPPSGSARYSCQDLYSFDHFAYGLVAWCIFADLCHSPLPSEERVNAEPNDLFGPSKLIDTCLTQLALKHVDIPLSLRLCLRACLDDNPMHWRKSPWRSLEGVTYWHAKAFEYGLETVPQSLINKGLISLHRNYGDITGNVLRRSRRLSEVLHGTRKHLLPVRRSKIWHVRRATLSQRGKIVKALFRSVKKQAPFFKSSRQSQFLSHPNDSECWDFKWLVEQIKRYADDFARRATKAHANQLYALLRNNVSFATLAWACHGEIGMAELSELDVQVLAVWLAELRNRACPRRATEIVSRLVLLVEKGCRIEDAVRGSDGVKSIFRIMLELAYRCRNDVARDVFMECIVRLQVQAMDNRTSGSMRPSLTYFLTGQGLPDHLGDMPDHETTGWTTALHESVKMASYRMVEALVLNEFQVNAFDAKGKIAYQYSSARLAQPGSEICIDGTESYEADRIAALLSQSADLDLSQQVQYEGQSNDDVSLPVGWDRVSLSKQQGDQTVCKPVASNTEAPVTLYLDRHFGSITLKRPTFSFFTDQRLALGFRRVHLPGQTYYLDLLRFLQPPSSLSSRSRISEPTYSLAYYEREASDSDTRRTLNLKQSVQVLYSRLQLVLAAMYAAVASVAWAVKSVALAVRHALTYLACYLRFVVKSTIRGLALPLSLLSNFVLVLIVPGQPINIYLGGVPVALVAHRFAWSFGVKLLINLVALASLSNLGQTALVVLVGLNRSDPILIDMAKMFINFIVVPFGNIHVEISCFLLMFRHNLAGAMIPFMLAAISWNFYCSVLGYALGLMRHSDVALNAFILPFLSLLLLDVDRAPNLISVLLAQITPFVLLVHIVTTGTVILLVYLGMTRSILAGRWLSMWERISSTKPFWWFWEGTGEILGHSLSAHQHSRSVLRLSFALVVLPSTITAAAFICSNIVSMIAEHRSQTLRSLTLYLLIPLAIRFSHLHLAILVLLKKKAPAWHEAYLRLTSLGTRSLLSERYYAPASHTFVLWALLYPFMSFVRLGQGQPSSVDIPDLNISRATMVCLALPTATYMSAVKQEDTRIRSIFW